MAEVSQDSGKYKGKGRGKKNAVRMDMTPMVDLAFLLLTFFMLTTTFVKPQTMELTMPDKPKTEDSAPLINERRVLNVVLGEENKVYWYVGLTNAQARVTDFSKEGIRKVLIEQNEQIKNMVVLIKPMENSKYENMVDILDEMSITNIARYALVEISAEDEDIVEKVVL